MTCLCTMMLVLSTMLLSLVSRGQGSARLPLWTDIDLWSDKEFEEIDFKLEFLMDNYKIISLEKCLHDNQGIWGRNTEEVFQNLTTRMRMLRPNSDAKILYYWAADTTFDCYKSIDELLERPELWLRDSEGYPIRSGPHKIAPYDFRVKEAADMWVTAALEQVRVAGGGSQGVFLDGLRRSELAGCRVKTCGEDGASCCQFSEEAEEEYHLARGEATAELRRQLHELDPTYILVGNGVMNYDFNAGNGSPTLDFYLDKIDGLCMEHVMAFEDVNSHATEQPFIKVAGLENLIKARNVLVEANKILLVRSFPGPVMQPISKVGTIVGPHLQPHHPYPQPETNLEMQQAYEDLVHFPLAVYLCAFAGPDVYFSYSLWYNIRQSVPCSAHPEDCHFPSDFSTLLDMDPGDTLPTEPTTPLTTPGHPVTEASWSGTTCSRWFQNFMVEVNLEDESSATWLPVRAN